MNWASIIKAVLPLVGVVASFFGKKKDPPKRAEGILGKPGEPSQLDKAKADADERARDKFDN